MLVLVLSEGIRSRRLSLRSLYTYVHFDSATNNAFSDEFGEVYFAECLRECFVTAASADVRVFIPLCCISEEAIRSRRAMADVEVECGECSCDDANGAGEGEDEDTVSTKGTLCFEIYLKDCRPAKRKKQKI